MAAQGDLFLSNSAVIGMYETAKAYEDTVHTAFYDEYKTAYKR